MGGTSVVWFAPVLCLIVVALCCLVAVNEARTADRIKDLDERIRAVEKREKS